MELKIKSLYDKKAILDLNVYVLKSKKVLLWIIAIANILVLGEIIIFGALALTLPENVYAISAALGVIDFFYIFLYAIAPRISMKKNKALGTLIEYCFYDTEFTIKAKNRFIDEFSTVKYSRIEKVGRYKKYLYLFIAANTAYIVDISGMSADDKLALRQKLSVYVGAKKVKWENAK